MTAGAFRLQAGPEVFAAIPAANAKALAHLVTRGAAETTRRDGIAMPPWMRELLALLRELDSEHLAKVAVSVPGSEVRTAEPPEGDQGAPWPGDLILIADAVALTGWSAGYLCRLARAGLGHKRAGRWELERTALLDRLGGLRADAGGGHGDLATDAA